MVNIITTGIYLAIYYYIALTIATILLGLVRTETGNKFMNEVLQKTVSITDSSIWNNIVFSYVVKISTCNMCMMFFLLTVLTVPLHHSSLERLVIVGLVNAGISILIYRNAGKSVD